MTSDRGDGRDAKGRWVKNKSGNPNRRPPDVPDLDMADLYNFSQYPEEITIRGEKHIMTRHEIVLFKLFESAIKGNITSQKSARKIRESGTFEGICPTLVGKMGGADRRRSRLRAPGNSPYDEEGAGFTGTTSLKDPGP